MLFYKSSVVYYKSRGDLMRFALICIASPCGLKGVLLPSGIEQHEVLPFRLVTK